MFSTLTSIRSDLIGTSIQTGPAPSLSVCLCYLEDEFLNPRSLGQEVQHGEAGIGPHCRHGHPVTSAGAWTEVVGKTRQIVHERVHPAFIETCNVDSNTDTHTADGGCSLMME